MSSGEEPPAATTTATTATTATPTTIDAESAMLYSDADLKNQLGILIREALRRGIALMVQDFASPPPPPAT